MVTNEIYLDIFTLARTMGVSYDFDLLVPEGCSWVVEWGGACEQRSREWKVAKSCT